MKDYNAILKRIAKKEKESGCPVDGVCDNCAASDSPFCAIRRLYKVDLNGVLGMLDDWDAAHPVKTYAQDFFEKFPNAGYYETLKEGKLPWCCVADVYGENLCPRKIYTKETLTCAADHANNHAACWNRPMPEGE